MEDRVGERLAAHEQTLKETVRDGWRLQAASKTREAWHLYKRRLFNEARALSLQAAEEDPGMPFPHFVASLACAKCGEAALSRRHAEKWLSMITAMPEAVSSWRGHLLTMGVLCLNACGPEDFTAVAAVRAFVGTLPHTLRDEILSEYASLKASGQYPAGLSLLRSLLADRYREWKSLIDRDIEKQARTRARDATLDTPWDCVFAPLILGLSCTWLLSLFFRSGSLFFWTMGLMGATLIIFCLISVLYRDSDHHHRRQQESYAKFHAELSAKETERWRAPYEP